MNYLGKRDRIKMYSSLPQYLPDEAQSKPMSIYMGLYED
jgi:hypothetical protein